MWAGACNVSLQIFQTASTYIHLVVALLLYCQALPRREGFASRIAIAFACTAALMALSVHLGFSMHPPLTDDASFFRALLSFLLVLVVATAAVLLIWQSSFQTALFCSTSAYLLQNTADSINRVLHLTHLLPEASASVAGTMGVSATNVLSAFLSAMFVYGLFYLLFIRRLTGSGLQGIRNGTMIFAVLIAMLVSIVFDLAIKDLPTFEIPWRYPVVLSMVHFAVCAFILMAEYEIIYNQNLRESVSTMERVVSEQERQYAVSRQTIDAINRRVHNMRHHVFSILAQDKDVLLDHGTLRQIAHELQVYDSSVKTGNTALDIVLTEKGLLCSQEGITLTCVADGHALDFMAASDIYTLFGTAIDGAIAAVKGAEVGSEGQQAVSLNVRDAMGMAAITVEHYLASPERIDPDSEAAGEARLETMRTIVERYGGTFALGDQIDQGVFHLDALIPR